MHTPPDKAPVVELEERVRRFVAEKTLLSGVRRLGLAVSGGSDSLSLLHLVAPICRREGIEPFVLNFDHAIPGEHSDADAAFVRGEAGRLGLPFHGERAAGIAAGGGQSLEMAARAARQAFYRRAAAHLRLDAIATGHQADDVAETLLLRLFRGAGAAGLSGLRPRSVLPPLAGTDDAPLVLVRPLLGLRREELRDWLRERNLGWREDPSNANEAIPRNEVRRTILPALARRGGGADDTVLQLAQSADILREEDAYLDGLASGWLAALPSDGGLPLARLQAELPLALQRRVARAWLLARFGAEAAGFASVGRILALGEGDVATLPGGHRVACASGTLRPTGKPQASAPAPAPMPVPGTVAWGGFTLETSVVAPVEKARGALDVWPAVCTLSLARIAGRPLTVRARQPGDRIVPFGLGGTKKIQDIFTDGKLPAARRDVYPLIVCGGEIAWVPGYRVAAPFAVRPGEACLRIRVSPRSAR